MNTKSTAMKALRLMELDSWARSRYPEEKFNTEEFRRALAEYSLITWGLGDNSAKNMAKIVQLRLTRKLPPVIQPPGELTDDQIEKMRVSEVLGADRAAHPEEHEVPKTDFPIIEES